MNEYEKKLCAAKVHPVLRHPLSAEGVEEFSIFMMIADNEADEFGMPIHEIIDRLKAIADNSDLVSSIPAQALPCYAALMQGVHSAPTSNNSLSRKTPLN